MDDITDADIDDARDALLRWSLTLQFIPREQCDLFRAALNRLEQDGHRVCRLSLLRVPNVIELLRRSSTATSSPWVFENWGMFGDWMDRLSFLTAEERGCFFHVEDALQFWQEHTSMAGTLSNQLQRISLNWARRGKFLSGVYELR